MIFKNLREIIKEYEDMADKYKKSQKLIANVEEEEEEEDILL